MECNESRASSCDKAAFSEQLFVNLKVKRTVKLLTPSTYKTVLLGKCPTHFLAVVTVPVVVHVHKSGVNPFATRTKVRKAFLYRKAYNPTKESRDMLILSVLPLLVAISVRQ